ncbi:YraN family protein [Acinetobacter soli]|uniref:YraN family protein n=1 Tax=Acinetobacter soli TaxID=487316 RepID=UPI0031BABDF7
MTQSSHHAEPHAHHLGVWAEQAALTLLQAHGFHLVQQNFRSRRGEIDLIVAKGDELVFVEVKARTQGSYAMANEVLMYSQQRKIIKTAQYFLNKYPHYQQFYCRFDVICFDFPYKIAKTVQQDFSNLRYDRQWIENAFTL